jgi:hypothetical protein
MKRLIAAITMSAVLAFAGTAQADEVYAPQCGKNIGMFAQATELFYSSTTHSFSGWVHQKCGSGSHSFEAEIQYTTDTGQHWTDAVADAHTVDYEFGTSVANAGVDYNRQISFSAYCGIGRFYREKVWDYDGGSVSNSLYCGNPKHFGGKN